MKTKTKPPKYYLHPKEPRDKNDYFLGPTSIAIIMSYMKRRLMDGRPIENVKMSTEEEWAKMMDKLYSDKHKPIKSAKDPRLEGLYKVYLNAGDYDEHWLVRAKNEPEAIDIALEYKYTREFTIDAVTVKDDLSPSKGTTKKELLEKFEFLNYIFEGDPDARNLLENPERKIPVCYSVGT